ncbi:MAG: DUF1015 domain-containing protein [Flavobacteriales bacterium]|jgi:uncharacterized protein (DUF1015 family)|nr:DUF1015 domain-containing protein [Flavobacteriales bacterium]
MAIVRPFKAIRPTRDNVHLFASRSYLTYSDEALKEKLEHNPFTFLHIINPEYKKKNKKSNIEKFKLVKQKFEEFKANGVLVSEDKKIFYLYKQKRGPYIFEGIIAACSVKDYLNGTIKVHEHTLTKREQMFKDYLDTTGFNADPVLLTYKGKNDINNLIASVSKTRSEYNFTTNNKVQHQLWLIDTEKEINLICNTFAEINDIYIADGHHRTSSSVLLSQQRNAADENNCNYFMSFLIAESQLNIINFNRLVKSLNGLSIANFIAQIKNTYTLVESTFAKGEKEGEIGMYLDGKCYLLIAKKGSYKDDCVNRLDPAILSHNILSPILGIKDEKTDKNISFVAGNIPMAEIKKRVDSGVNAVAFILKPIPIKALKEVADKRKIMPPKSTYIQPKLRSGITIYPID